MTQLFDQTLLSTKDASALSGYNADYLSRLCRSGKIAGTQIGRTWLVNRASLEQFVREQEERKVQISTELSQAREKEYQQAQQRRESPRTQKRARAAVTPVQSPFMQLLRAPATALVLTALIMTGSVYAATAGPIAAAVDNAGALAMAVQQEVTGSTNATEPRLRIASNVRVQTGNGIPETRVAQQRAQPPIIDGKAIAWQLARVDVPDVRAGDSFRILTYDSASDTEAALLASRAQTERAFGRFMSDDTPLPERISDAASAIFSSTRVAYDAMFNAYSISLNRAGESSLAFAANARDIVLQSPRVSGALLDGYSNAAYAWVDGSHAVVERTADAELATGPVVLATLDTAQQQTHAFALATQSAIDAQLDSAHGTAALAEQWAPHAESGLVAIRAAVSVPATPQPEQIVATPVTFSPFDAATFLNLARQFALATYTWIHGFSLNTRLAFARLGNRFFGDRLAIVPLPPAVTIPGFTARVPEGNATTPDFTYAGGNITRVTNVSNYFSYTGVTKQMLDDAIDAATLSLSSNSGGGTTIITNSSGGGFSGGDLTADNIHGTADTTIDGLLAVAGTITSGSEISAPFFTATSLSATSSFPNIISNSFSIGGDTITDFTGTGLAIVNGVLTATATSSNAFQQGGNIFGATATLGTQDANPLSFITNNLNRMTIDASGNVSIATTSTSLLSVGGAVTADTFNARGTGTSSLPRIATQAFAIGSNYFTSLTGTGLLNTGGVLTLDTSGDWTGTFGGLSSLYYLDANNLTNFEVPFDSHFQAKTTDDLNEGATNQYFTNDRADARINATTTIGTLTSAPNLGTVSTALTGLLKATSGVLSVASGGVDYENPLTFAYPLQRALNTISLAFGTTTANSWSQLQTFGNIAAAQGTSTVFQTNKLGVGSNYFTSLTGTGLLNTGGVLTLDTSGDWTGTFGGQAPGYYTNLDNQTGVLTQERGGTGFSSFTAGDILYADNTGTLQKLPVGSSGSVLKVQAGLPAWGVDQTVGGGGSDGIFATSSGLIYPLDTSNTVLVGTNATSTTNSILEVNGQVYISSKLSIATTTAPAALSIGGSGYLTGGLGVGILNTVAGTLHTSGNATIGGNLAVTGATTLANATSSSFYTSSLGINSSYFTSLTGTGLLNTSGVLTLDTSLVNSLADARINATTTIGTLTSAPNLGTIKTSLTGLLKATSGVLSAASAGTDYLAPNSLTATYPILYSANNFSLAFGTTTANSWSALQQFNGGASSTQLTTTGNTYLGTTGGNVGIGTTSPFQTLSVQGSGYLSGDLSVANFIATGTASITGTLATGPISVSQTSGAVGIAESFNNTSSVSGAGNQILFKNGGVSMASISAVVDGSINNSYLAFNVRGSAATFEAARFLGSNGSFGIGTTTPSQRLSVQGNGLFSGDISLANLTATGTANITGNTQITGGLGVGITNSTAGSIKTSGSITTGSQFIGVSSDGAGTPSFSWTGDPSTGVFHGGSNVIGFSTSGIERARIDGNGFLGIGTTTPGSILSVGSVANFTTATSTFYGTGGLNLSAGCYAVNGTCITLGSLGGTLSVPNGGTGSTTLSGILVGNGTSAVNTLTLPSFLSLSGSTLSLNGALGIANGGTGTTTQVTNGVNYYDGTRITSGTGLTFNGTNLGVGSTSPWAMLSVNPNGITGPEFAIGSSTATHFLVSNTGLVGIGTTTSTALFSVQGSNPASGNAALAIAVIGGTGGSLGAGGGITLQTGNGGTGAAGANGFNTLRGGTFSLTGGTGGANSSSGSVRSGMGGALNFTGGTGGTSVVGGNFAGDGGAIALTGGTAGNNSAGSGFGGAGGSVLIAGGNGGTGVTGFGAGGTVTLLGGLGGGVTNTLSQASVLVDPSLANGGDIELTAGNSPNNNGSGGPISFVTGNGGLGGGDFTFTGGNATSTGNGGSFIFTGGVASSTTASAFGGAITLTGGDASSTVSSVGGGPITLTGGSGGTGSITNGSGGSITLNGGAAGLAGGSVGNVLLATLRGKVGIGTTSPAQLLSVQGNGFFSGNLNAANFTATGTASITGNTQITGGLGVGISNSTAGSIKTSGSITTGSQFIGVSSDGAGTPSFSWTGDPSTGIFHGGSNVIGFSTSGIERARIDGNGFLGIGTSTPGSILSVGSVANFTTATSTFYSTGGLNLAGGCYAINGTCITLGTLAGTLGVANGGTGSTTLTGILVGNGTSAVNTLTLPSFLSLSGSTLSLNGALGIANGGTGTTTQVTNGVNYYDGTKITSQSTFTFDGSNLSIPTNGWLATGGNLFAYASSTNAATIFGLQAGGKNATTSATLSGTTAIGFQSLTALTTGTHNTALGYQTLLLATSTSDNTAVGYQALRGSGIATGFQNTALGSQSLMNNADGNYNVGIGVQALNSNTRGGINTAVGTHALFANTTGSENVALGYFALSDVQTALDTIAIGSGALTAARSATSTIAIGTLAGGQQDLSNFNSKGGIFLGDQAGYAHWSNGADFNTIIGYQAGQSFTSGYGNLLLGADADLVGNLTSGGNNIGIGYNTIFPSATASNQLNIGGLIYGTLPATTTTFKLPTSGALGIGSSSPIAKFSIHANNGDTAKTLFAIGSSTASATTTLFSISNTGQIFAQGNLGLGTTSPSQLLSVQGNGLFSGSINSGAITTTGITNTGNEQITGGLGVGVSNGTAGSIQTSGAITTGSQFLGLSSDGASAPSFSWTSDPSTGIFHGGSNVIGFSTSGIERARIDGNGFFGIGTSTPATKLSVEGNALIHGTVTVDGLGSGLVKATNGLLGLASAGTDYQAPLTATYPIQLSSNVLSLAFGTTTANSWSALQQFNGNASTTGFTNSGQTWLTVLGTPAGAFLAVDSNGKVIATTTPSGSFTNTLANGGTATTTFYNKGIVFSDGSKLTQADGSGASILNWDNTNGFLGIGTSTPGSLLSLGGIANFTTATSTFYGTGGINLAGGCFAVNGTCVGSGAGTVTSVNASGGTTGLTFSGGPVTNSGTLTLAGTLGAANGGTGSTTLSGILVGNGTSAVNTLTLPSFLSLSGSTLSLNGALGIANGGTGTTTQVTNGVNYYDGTRITSGTGLTFNGTNLGVGTTSPGSLLSIGGIANFTTATSTLYGTGGINISGGCYAVNGVCLSTGGSFTNTLANGGTATTTFYANGLVFSDGTKLTQANGSGASVLTWNNTSGFLGIGTTTPAWALSVSGTSGVRFKSTTNQASAFVVENSVGTSTLQVDTLDNASSIFSIATSSGSTYFFVDPSGNVGLSTTTPTALLTVASGGSERFANLGAGTLQTDALGNISVSSDERLKDINGSFDRGLAELMQLNPILYHWNATSKLDQSTQYAGFSAQNVQSVIPEAIDTDPRGYLTLSDRPILAASVNAIKELAGRTDELSISTTTLGSRVNNIEASLAAQQAAQLQGQPVNAPSVSADSITTKSLSVNGNAFATSFVAPATPIAFTIGSTTGTLPNEVLVDGGVDLYKAATYAITGVQALQAQSDLLASRLDAVELRVTMLEAEASSTPQTGGSITDFMSQIGLAIKNGIAHFTSLAFTNLIASPGSDGASAVATSTIPAGAIQMTVGNNLVRPTSEIFVTITSPLNGSWYISQKTNGSFTVNLSQIQTQDVTFDYFIVQTEGGTQVASVASAPVAPPPSTGTSTPPTTDASSTPPIDQPANPPTITLHGDAAVNLTQGDVWTDPGAGAQDAQGNDLTASIVVTGSVDTSTPGLYTLHYSVVDSSGASADVARVVNVAASGGEPVVSDAGEPPSGG